MGGKKFENAQTSNLHKVLSASMLLREVLLEIKKRADEPAEAEAAAPSVLSFIGLADANSAI